MANEIKVIFDANSNGTPVFQQTNTIQSIQPSQSEIKQNNAFTKSMAAGLIVGKQVLNFATSNAGTISGDSLLQQRANNAKQVIELGVLAYMSPYAAIAQVGVQLGTTAFSEYVRLRKESNTLSVRRAKYGYTDTKSITTSRRH